MHSTFFLAYDQDDNGLDSPLDQNSFGIQEQDLKLKEEVWLQELAELLHVVFTEDGIYTLMGPDPKSVVVGLIQKSVSQHFPKPPADLDQNLQQHLMNVQNTVLSELTRLSPYLEPRGLMGCLIDSYHHQTWDHLQRLLQDTSSSQNSFVLIKWGLKTYLRYLSVRKAEQTNFRWMLLCFILYFLSMGQSSRGLLRWINVLMQTTCSQD